MTQDRRQHRHGAVRRRRGSALTMAVIVSVVITGLVMAMAWTAGAQASMASGVTQVDRAFFAAEAGAMRVAWFCKNKKMANITSPLTGTLGGYSYSASWTTVSGSTIAITSVGSSGTASYTCHLTVMPPEANLPTFATGADFNNKNINIQGDMWTGGNYTNGGSGALNGDLYYSGTATGTSAVSGNKTQMPFQMLDVTALGNTLSPYVGSTYSGTQTNKNFNFNLVPGTKKVIWVNGDVVNPTFTGMGTIYVVGTVSSLASFGTATNPVNIVATGDINTDNGTMYGALYAAGGWNRHQVNLTGMVYVNGISPSNSGSSSMTMSAPAWFDPRLNASGNISSRFLNFSGPLP